MAFSVGLFLKFKDDLDYRQLIVCDLIKYTSLSPLLGWDINDDQSPTYDY